MLSVAIAMSDQTPTEPRDARFSVSLTKSELDALEEWMWENRIRSRSDAARQLIQIGLKSVKD